MRAKNYLIVCVVAVLVSVMGLVVPVGAQAPAKEPIKIGLLYPVTGVLAVQGISMMNAAKLFFEEKGLKVAGRDIKLVTEDTEAKPEVGLMKTKKVVDLDKVNLICGYLNSAVSYAIRDYVNEKKIPTLTTGSGARHSRDMFSPYVFRIPQSMFQQAYEPSKWWYSHPYKGKSFKRLIWVGADFAAPHEGYKAFKKGFEEAGGKFVQEFWPPFGATDFAPYLSAMKVNEADAILVAVWGDMATRFVNQWAEYGLNKKIPIIGFTSFTDEGTSLPGMGVNADGILSWYSSCPQTDIPSNKKFVDAYKKRYNNLPGHFAYFAYIAASTAYDAMERVNGNVEGKEKFLDALRKTNISTPMGYKAYFDEKQGMVHDFLFLEARKVGNECHLFEIGRLKNVKDPYKVFP